MKIPTEEDWELISAEFAQTYEFPGVIGALDGKHIRINKPADSGSSFFNYKKFFSIVLLSLADSRKRFIHCECEINGVISDGGVYRHSALKQLIDSGALHIPQDKVILADGAFPLSPLIMTPFGSTRATTTNTRRYNNKLSSARSVVECAFGIFATRFRLFKTTMNLDLENCKVVTLACCLLHNILIDKEGIRYTNINDLPVGEFTSINTNRATTSATLSGELVRDRIMNYLDQAEQRRQQQNNLI